jgi:prepilin-type N-terminal cleavage/methylation domain-containing protein
MKCKKITLVEVMIVIAIIGVLASIIFASYSRAREYAYTTQCAGNLKQIGTTLQVFSSSNRNIIADYNWMHNEGIRDNYLCPKDDDPELLDHYNHKGDKFDDVKTSYGFNLSAYGKKSTRAGGNLVISFDSHNLRGYEYTPDEDGNDSSADGDGYNGNDKNGNNGHGNNEDGVDSSNPGNGNGGPNGELDQSGNIDDEIKDGKDKKTSEDYGEVGAYGSYSSTSGTPEIFSGIHPNDAQRWYYNNLNYRHLDKALQLMMDGSVVIIKNPYSLDKLIYKYDPQYNYSF